MEQTDSSRWTVPALIGGCLAFAAAAAFWGHGARDRVAVAEWVAQVQEAPAIGADAVRAVASAVDPEPATATEPAAETESAAATDPAAETEPAVETESAAETESAVETESAGETEPGVDAEPAAEIPSGTEVAVAAAPTSTGAPSAGSAPAETVPAETVPAETVPAAEAALASERDQGAAPAPSVAEVDSPVARVFTFRRDAVLGTSFSLTLVGVDDEADAQHLEGIVLDEIERLRQVFSTWDPTSEVSRINATPWEQRQALPISEDLHTVLRVAKLWRVLSLRAFDPYLGELHEAWKSAAAGGTPPDAATLARLVAASERDAGFKLAAGAEGPTLTCTRAGRFDLDGIAKGYVVNCGLRALSEAAADVQGAMLELGGDLRVQGEAHPVMRAPWSIAVADPRDHADNSPPLCWLALRDQAVASSGGYARTIDVGGRRRPEILDPRTGEPVEGVLGATVVAGDAATADALATALCVLPPAEGLKLIAKSKGAEAAIVDAAGQLHTSPGWDGLLGSGHVEPWPEGFRVELAFEQVDSTPDRRFKRHGTAVWVEDMAGQRVRLLALWFDRRELKYVKDLPAFWQEGWLGSGGEDDPAALRTWTRASRKPGHYTLAWDGRDDDGNLVPQGRYRLRVDVNREKGPNKEQHTTAAIELTCGAESARGVAEDQPELRAVSAHYGPADAH